MEFLTVEEAADRLGVSVATVRRQAATGELAARKSGKQWLIEGDHLHEPGVGRARRVFAPPQAVDLLTALRHVRSTDLSELWVPDILRYEDRFHSQGEVLASAARRFHGEPPEPATEVDVTKTPFFTRSAILITLEDRVAYQAAIATLARQVEAALPEQVFSARLSTNNRWFLKKGTDLWLDWKKRVRKEVGAGFPWMIKTDLVSYFDHIPHQLLLDEISSLNPEPTVLEALRRMLAAWAIVPGIGIPQGPNASRLLGNLYLLPVDRAMIAAGYNYFRYMDDIRILGRTRADVIAGMRLLEKECRRRGLVVSSGKTELLEGASAARDGLHRDRDRAMYFINSDQLPKARAQLKKILKEALKNQSHPDTSSVKFSLWRLTMIREHTVLRTVLGRLDDLAPAASVVVAYLRHFITREHVVRGIAEFLRDPQRAYSTSLVTWLFAGMLERSGRLPVEWSAIAARYVKDRNQPSYLRAIAASVFTRAGSVAEIAWVKSEINHEYDPVLLRAYAVALHWVGSLDPVTAKSLATRSSIVAMTVKYLNGRQILPSLLDRDRFLLMT